MQAHPGHLLVASAHAGSTDVEQVEAARAQLAVAGAVELVETETPEELDAALDRLEGRTLVVAGGDGSLHLVVSRLHARHELADVRMGLVPLGTGNDLARALGVPLDPTAAARVVLDCAPRRLDLVVDDVGGIVVNAVHVGVGADAAAHAGRLKPRLGPLAYPLGAVSAGLRSTGWKLRVEVDGRVLADGRRRSLMVGIGNGRGIGGGTPLLPHAEPDDGLLDVVVSAASGPVARVRYGAALSSGSHLEDKAVRYARGTTVVISGEQVGVNADGELGDEIRRRRWTVQPGAWSLVRP
ncbi:MAG: putative lipid kinase [Frankiales bacterium]|nr:putative lipid kinase [Frankiales bacterium]